MPEPRTTGGEGRILGSAEFSRCGKHRLRLDRWWADGPRALVLGCNPSDAGAERNDPTIHRLNTLLRDRVGVCGYTMMNFGTLVSASPADFWRWRETAWRDDPDYAARRMEGERLIGCKLVMFKAGAEAVETTLRRAKISGRVEVNGTVQDHWADIYVDRDTWTDVVALDANSYRALKTRWMRCKVEKEL